MMMKRVRLTRRQARSFKDDLVEDFFGPALIVFFLAALYAIGQSL